MTAIAVENNSMEKREKRAMSIAAMGLVNREGDKFMVSTPSLRGKQTSYEVRRDTLGKIRCNCLEFEEMAVEDANFRCEHIFAVKFALAQKNSEPVTKQKVGKQTESESSTSKLGEQKENETSVEVLANGQAETVKDEKSSLTETQGETIMNTKNLQDTTFITAEEAEFIETRNNVVQMNFASTLRNLHQNINPELVKQRDGWKDRSGNVHKIDYVEWHTVADILDEKAPNWTHTVKDVRQIGSIVTVTVAITIDGITREGLGTGYADSEMGIKKAEHDALKRAAVKFGIARELYKRESDVIEREGAVPPSSNNDGGFPANPVATSLMDLVTAKQLGMIRAISREKGIEADEECQTVLSCKTDELSKKAASAFIQHLQDLQRQQEVALNQPLRKVG
ncbi:MAG TPA: Rad52/Rad22 family DNA repair protein [Pyrinomonadaceae bacterium]|nr:Rad52/Rad22 family DNA repair protein [Pyrinomonadaceae bacterium]